MKSASLYSRYDIIFLIFAILLLPVMVSGDSLWLDEGTTAMYAAQKDLSEWRSFLIFDTGGDCEMPLGMFFSWVGARMFGTGECQIRVINIFWGLIGLLCAWRVGKYLKMAWLPLFFAIQPFFWFYTDEARPYAAQIACGAILLLAVVQFLHSEGTGLKWAWTFSVGIILSCLSTMLAPASILAMMAAGIYLAVSRKWRIDRRVIIILLGTGIILLPLGYYYIGALVRGAKGIQLWDVSVLNFLYFLYEVTGAVGIGPSTYELREWARASFDFSNYPLLFHLFGGGILTVAIAIAFIGAAIKRPNNFRKTAFIALSLTVTIAVLFFFGVGVILHKAFWARHFSPLFSFYATALALAISLLFGEAKNPWRIIIVPIVALLITSSLMIRFSNLHRNEDYRWAALNARTALEGGKSVYWAAGRFVGIYYDLDTTNQTFSFKKQSIAFERLIFWFNQDSPPDPKDPLPDEIFISRPDIFDERGVLREFMEKNNYHLREKRRSFSWWTRQ